MLPITQQKTIYGYERPIMNIGMVKGRNCLTADGYTQCENKTYYKKENEYWHYNHLSKCWYYEKQEVNKCA